MQIPEPGEFVRVTMENLSRRREWESLTETLEGVVVPTFKWLEPGYICITGDASFPVRSIRLARVKKIELANGAQISVPVQAVNQDRTWQIQGSRGDLYTVTRRGNQYSCNCPAGSFRKNACRHVKEVLAMAK